MPKNVSCDQMRQITNGFNAEIRLRLLRIPPVDTVPDDVQMESLIKRKEAGLKLIADPSIPLHWDLLWLAVDRVDHPGRQDVHDVALSSSA